MSKKNKGGRPPQHESSFKVAVAREYLTGILGYGQLGKKHGLSGDQVRHMVCWYKKRYPEAKAGDCTLIPVEDEPVPVNSAALSRELKDAHLKIEALETLIEIASKELGVDIRKKPGAKQ